MAEKLSFYDLKAKKKFTTSTYKLTKKSGRNFAVAKAPSGCDAYRIVAGAKKK
jgi:hypothetical protein